MTAASPQRLHWDRYRQPFPAGAKLVSRATKYGNPFKLPKPYTDDQLEQVLHWHRRYLAGDPQAVQRARAARWRHVDLYGERLIAMVRRNLAGHDLVCTGCPPGQRCHGDLLLAVAAGADP